MKTSTLSPYRPSGRRRGFTLAEVSVAAGVSLLIITMALFVLIAVMRIYTRTDIKNSVGADYRDLTRLMVEQGNQSNGFYIYPSFAAGDRDGPTKQVGPNDDPKLASGDLVVFVYFSIKDIKTSPNMQGVSRIIGFFRENPGNLSSPIRWFDSNRQNWGQTYSVASPKTLDIPASGANLAIESLLPPESFLKSCPVVALHTMGAAADSSTGKFSLFCNSTSTNNSPSFNVSGFILRSTSTEGGGLIGYESQTAFNLTIAPRSI